MKDDKRLIEDYLPIQAISKEASREKSVRKGHISTLHLWWARRPLVACRAAVYGALVPASRYVVNDASVKAVKKGRENSERFVSALCLYPGDAGIISEAEQHILEAHAARLSEELGAKVTVADIRNGDAPRPRVLDMFAGGGAIPLEALRLGCEAYANDLNPVAHIIELCTLVYPQKYGKPDKSLCGMTGPKNGKGETTWGGLSGEMLYWGNWVVERVRAEIRDLYPLVPDPKAKSREMSQDPTQRLFPDADRQPRLKVTDGYLTPVAYLWTRTVRCKNRTCDATVPLVRQTWLSKKKGRYAAMRMLAQRGEKFVKFEVVESKSEKDLGFDPAGFSKGGNATCPFCATVADNDYIISEGWQGRIKQQMMAVLCTRPDSQSKIFIAADAFKGLIPSEEIILQRLEALCATGDLTVPAEPIANLPPDSNDNSLGIRVRPYGLRSWGDLFTRRQLMYLLELVAKTHDAESKMKSHSIPTTHSDALVTYLGLLVDRLAGFGNSFCGWNYHEQAVANVFGRQAIPMVWDFAEVSPYAEMSGGLAGGLNRIVDVIEYASKINCIGVVQRGSAVSLQVPDNSIDAVITDPPYYDNVPYSDISDFYYVWLKRTVGHLYPDHFANVLTPKKQEIIADTFRHGGSKERAKIAYEQMMASAFSEAHRVLKPGGQLVVV